MCFAISSGKGVTAEAANELEIKAASIVNDWIMGGYRYNRTSNEPRRRIPAIALIRRRKM
jgi:hypothetical protein